MKKILLLLAILLSFYSAYPADAIECMFCHALPMGFGGIYPPINSSLFGSHININSTGGTGNVSSGDCMACHYSATTFSFHTFPVSTYSCEDCHMNSAVPGAPKVNNHARNANISVNSFCSDCHSKTANHFSFSINASAAHYLRNASFGIPTGETYCAFCHHNSTTIYKDVMQDQNNNQINNHTTGIINPGHLAGRPDCVSCHGQDKLHGLNISKPALNSGFCGNCHKNDILQKKRHSDKVECISCHTDLQSDIHNIKYMMQDGSYRSINATGCIDCHDFGLPAPYFRLPFQAADCTTCHQRVLLKFSLAPQLPTPLRHSNNPFSGALWNGSQTGYWNNNSQQSACNYCHGNTIHESNALGNIENIRSGGTMANTSYWCANCHYMNTSTGNYSYNATAYSPVPPEIQNNTGLVPQKARDGTPFFNHSLKVWSDSICRPCHSADSQNSTTLFIHNVSTGGGGADCSGCHDIDATGAPADKRIDILAFENGVHDNLNNGGNRACWACHGDGTEPTGHPAEYRSPRKCNSDDCHSLSQSYRAPMVYSHFKNAGLNSNPNNTLNSNVTTQNDCEDCHANSVTAEGKNLISTASHYASPALPDSINCIYCHLNENNSKMYGNAILINKNRTSLVELERVRNKFTIKAGESVGLGYRFKLNLLEVSSDRYALIELLKDDITVDRIAVGSGNYTYEEILKIDNSSIKVPVIVLNFTGFFNSDNVSFIQFEGLRLKRVHAENKTTSCYLCHLYPRQKIKYRIIERVDSNIDHIYYSEELVNYTDKKEYNETEALRVLANLSDTGTYADIGSGTRKAILEGEEWNISRDFSLQVRSITIDSDEVFMNLRAGNYSYEDIVKKGEFFEYAPAINYLGYQSRNITIFRAKVPEIIQSKPKNMVVLEEVVALSPDIKKIEENQTLEGYNASWLWKNSTLTLGKIPSDFHSPQVFDGRDGGGDCSSCHGTDGILEMRVISLGKHGTLNGGGNGPCYACHGGREGIQNHPSEYKTPRDCKSCHAAIIDNYSAIYIGDEEHKNGLCEGCHLTNFHNIKVYEIIPSIKEMALIKQDNKAIIKAFASAGYKMRVRGARYYLDSPARKFNMSPADGAFDSQMEEVIAQINVSDISPGKHVIYVEAMERDNKWGTPSSLVINFEGKELKPAGQGDPAFAILLGGFAVILFALSKLLRVDLADFIRKYF